MPQTFWRNKRLWFRQFETAKSLAHYKSEASIKLTSFLTLEQSLSLCKTFEEALAD
jgi:hypothetical protein